MVGCDQCEPLRGARDKGHASSPWLGFCAYLVSHPVVSSLNSRLRHHLWTFLAAQAHEKTKRLLD